MRTLRRTSFCQAHTRLLLPATVLTTQRFLHPAVPCLQATQRVTIRNLGAAAAAGEREGEGVGVGVGEGDGEGKGVGDGEGVAPPPLLLTGVGCVGCTGAAPKAPLALRACSARSSRTTPPLLLRPAKLATAGALPTSRLRAVAALMLLPLSE